MGRKRVELTTEQLAERKAKYWGAERNKRRQDRYANDLNYRLVARNHGRQGYRIKQAELGKSVRADDCRGSLPDLTNLGMERKVTMLDIHDVLVETRQLCFTIEELAYAMGRDRQIIYRWTAAKMFPLPVYDAMNELNRWQKVYLRAEVEGLLNAFGQHQQESQYYKIKHTAARSALFAAVAEARQMQQEHAHDNSTTYSAPPASPHNALAGADADPARHAT